MRRALIPIVCAGAALLSGGTALAQAIEKGDGEVDQFTFAKNSAIENTTSTTFTTVPGMEVSFRRQPAPPARALVRFCAEGNMFGTGTGAVQVVADVDGAQLGDEIQFFSNEDSAVKPRCYEWATNPLGRGSHTAKISWRLTLGPSSTLTGRFHDTILTVLHR